jgi:flagellar protein FlbD
MIKVTRLNHVPLILNSDLIEHIDMTPDTVITLTSGQKYMVLETAEEIVDKVIEFRRRLNILGPAASAPASPNPAGHSGSPSHGR